MRLRLPPHWIELLVAQPESGMGYQRVSVEFVDGRQLTEALVFNAEELEVPAEFAGALIRSIKPRD